MKLLGLVLGVVLLSSAVLAFDGIKKTAREGLICTSAGSGGFCVPIPTPSLTSGGQSNYNPEYKRLWEEEHARDVRNGWTKQTNYKRPLANNLFAGKRIVGGFTKVDGSEIVFVK